MEEDDSSRREWKIKVRVSRLCNVHNPSKKEELLYVAKVLIDEEGEYVYATIPSYICNRFRPKILDGKIHIIKKFDIVPNKREYRVVGDNLYGVIVNEIEKANYFAIEIEDLMGKRVRITLWDQCLANYRKQKELSDSSETLIVTVSSLMVKNYKGYNSIATSTSSSLYINLDIPKDLICYCYAEVKDIVAEKPWNYPSCFNCTNKPTQRANDMWCDNCQKIIETQTIRYRIELKVRDNKCSTNFVVFDNEARRLIGQDAMSLYDSQASEDEDDENYNPIPDVIYNTFVAKKYKFKIKVCDFNHGLTRRKRFNVIDISEEFRRGMCSYLEYAKEELTTQQKRKRHVFIVDESDEEESKIGTKTSKDSEVS
ncbi:hypothetical protein RND81_01G167000 [Saponaria officinalis]|uniref:Replication factor A C-terminal domain-containing protein n=1 Tax=Saponaria officinalis TaxID=3572 RepID=A0AAW1NG32_SAPOF